MRRIDPEQGADVIARTATVMRRPLLILTSIYTALLILRPHEFVPALAGSPLLLVFILVAFAVWLFTPDKGTELAQFRALPFFLAFVWLSLGAAGWWGGIVDALQHMLPPILLFVVITGCVRSLRELRLYSLVIIGCACVLVLHGHLQVTVGQGWTGEPMIDGRITYSGIFNDPNDIGLLFVVALALSLFVLHTLRGRPAKLLLLAAIGWLLYGVVLTDSRGTLLAVLIVLGLDAWRVYGKTAVIVFATVAVPALMAYTRLAALSAQEESADNRIEAWYEGVHLLISSPIFGVGWGMFSDENGGLTAHNSIVLAMAELGMPGYVFWLAFVLLSGVMIYRLGYPPPPVPGAAVARRWWFRTPPASPRRWQRRSPGTDAALRVGAPVSGKEVAERSAARHLGHAAAGFAVGAFFLSQSYKAPLFIVCGLIVGRYLGMREAGIALPEFRLADRLPMVVAVSIGSIAAMWLLTLVLL